jgi:hypothetical protein
MSWFAFDGNGKQPETLLLPIWFLDSGVRSWNRSFYGGLEETTTERRLEKDKRAGHASLHHGDPVAVLGLDDAWASVP